MSIKPIDRPLDGERVIALSPENANAAATDWRRRPNLFPGRALTAPTLEQSQRWQAGHIAVRGQAFTRGVCRGLEVSYTIEPAAGGPIVRVQVTPGRALAASGEDVVLPAPVEVRLADLPVVAEPAVFAEAIGDAPPGGPAPGGLGVVRPRSIGGPRLGDLIAVRPDILPPVGVLVLQPVAADRSDFDPTDPCERCACGDGTDLSPESVEDWRTADGVRLLWYAWPDEWRVLPPDTSRRRNALAHVVFDAEAALAQGHVLPWEEWGAPVAIIGVNAAWQPVFADRASVVRQGGRARDARLMLSDGRLTAGSHLPGLWQARIEQLAEQLAEMGNPIPDAASLQASFTRLPPAGLLPINVVNLDVLPLNLSTESLQTRFFPAGFEIDAVPVPLPQLDVAIREAAPLAAIDFSTAERVRVLVPVTQASYEPRLLFEEAVAPEFQDTLDRFTLRRARALGMRQGLRAGTAALTKGLTGVTPVVPSFDDDSLALEREVLQPWGPPPAGGGHRAQLAAGTHQHFFLGTTATLATANEPFFAWVYLDPDNPPRTLMLQWHAGGTWEHRAYWGENLIDWGVDGTVSRRRVDQQLPVLGQWVRVTVDPALVGLNPNTPIDGMSFTLFDGRAAYGPVGLARAAGDSVWFSNRLPAGASVGGTYAWSFLTENDLWAPFEASIGLAPPLSATASAAGLPPTGVIQAIEDLRTDPALAVLSTHERAQLDARGVEGFVAYLKSRADRADDLVDYGFVKVQTDVYRVRQLVLGTTAATRLAISPALATIAKAETATASQEQISSFFSTLVGTAPIAPAGLRLTAATDAPSAPPVAFEVVTPPVATRALTVEGLASARADFGTADLRGTIGGSSATRGTTTGTTGVFTTGIGTRADAAVLTEPVFTADFDTRFRTSDVATIRDLSLDGGLIGVSTTPPATPIDVVNASPIVGKANIRTSAIAQRLEDPKAIEAKDYTAATRHDSVASLLRLADQLRAEDGGITPGLFDGIDVYGVRDDPFVADIPARRVPLTTFITNRALLPQLLSTPVRTRTVPGASTTLPDEGAYFSDSVDLSDNTVALMRQLEGRIKLYRDAIAAAERVRAGVRDGLARGNARLAAVADALAEARHDVGVAKALLAEETDRIAAINRRRAAVLSQEVRFLAFVRPREADILATAPRHQVDPGLIDAPAPGCLAEHHDVPEELADMLRVVREAPAQWFVQVPALFDRLDRPDLLVKVLQSAQSRARLTAAPIAVAAPANRLVSAIASVKTRQAAVVSEARAIATQIDLSTIRGLTWQGARDRAVQVVSLGDLIDGEHGRGDVARRAAQTFDEIGRMAGCLYAELSNVLPSIRLDWAETLSQFDSAPPLRRLGALARWDEIPYVDRHRMQAFVDWLFSRISLTEPRAEALMNDVVRMCLLLASHAPVGRLIAGRLPRPITVRPGVRLPLTAFDPAKLRIGMEALVYRESAVVARAIVEDIGATEIATRVIHTTAPQVDLDVSVRVQFAPATAVSRTAATKAAFGVR